MTDTNEMIERLRRRGRLFPASGGGTITAEGMVTSYVTDDGFRYINPDGPEAADRIEALEAAILEARGHIRRGCDMVPDEDEGLASDVFARAINHADLCLSKALGAAE